MCLLRWTPSLVAVCQYLHCSIKCQLLIPQFTVYWWSATSSCLFWMKTGLFSLFFFPPKKHYRSSLQSSAAPLRWREHKCELSLLIFHYPLNVPHHIIWNQTAALVLDREIGWLKGHLIVWIFKNFYSVLFLLEPKACVWKASEFWPSCKFYNYF